MKEIKSRLAYWLMRNEYKQCRACCLFCKYYEACIDETIRRETIAQMLLTLDKLEQRLGSGDELSDRELEVYNELRELEKEGMLGL